MEKKLQSSLQEPHYLIITRINWHFFFNLFHNYTILGCSKRTTEGYWIENPVIILEYSKYSSVNIEIWLQFYSQACAVRISVHCE